MVPPFQCLFFDNYGTSSNYFTGTPGISQCPIAPGETLTYTFQATQYGTSWYHSHFSLQIAVGLAGPIVIHGPTSADYDVDVGPIFLTDWFHTSVWDIWVETQRVLALEQPEAQNGLINGMNPYPGCTASNAKCISGAQRFEVAFEPGKRYLFRVIGALMNGYQKFAVDGHTMTVVASDLVPIVPYETDNIIVGGGQRYDVIIEADQTPGENYWLRAPYQTACNQNSNENANNILGIVRYRGANSTTDPTTTISPNVDDSCGDEPYASLTPWVQHDVAPNADEEYIQMGWYYEVDLVYHWTLHGSNLLIDWSSPSLLALANDNSSLAATENILVSSAPSGSFLYLIVQDLTLVNAYHPMHLHGHDFYILAQGEGTFIPGLVGLNTKNPPRRDTASSLGNGYLVLGIKMDNPG